MFLSNINEQTVSPQCDSEGLTDKVVIRCVDFRPPNPNNATEGYYSCRSWNERVRNNKITLKKATTEIIAQYEGTTLTMLQKKKKS